MITVNNLSMQFGGQWLFQRVDLQFTAGNCYGIIGANGAGKSTFLRILSGELDSTSGAISIQPGVRMSVLKQDQFAYDAHTVLDTVIMGNERLYRVGKEKDALYEKPDFSDEDGLRASRIGGGICRAGGLGGGVRRQPDSPGPGSPPQSCTRTPWQTLTPGSR